VLLDEESYFPRATDETLVSKLNEHLAGESLYTADSNGRAVFAIRHYAGLVRYTATGFLEKNRDNLVRFCSMIFLCN
jgi:myosin heavy subunit